MMWKRGELEPETIFLLYLAGILEPIVNSLVFEY